MKVKKMVVILMICTILSLLFGCKEPEPFMLDGPGMINPASWDSFIVSRQDNIAQNNFSINVVDGNDGLVVTGELCGSDGKVYTEEVGILLPPEEAAEIFALEPGLLKDQQELSESEIAELFPDGTEILDDSKVEIVVYLTDGSILKKVDEDSFSIKVYEIVRPCFENKEK